MMEDSYSSVQYAQGMLDAQDGESDVLLRYVAGDCTSREDAKLAFIARYAEFSRAYARAKDNITHGGEDSLLKVIDSVSELYTQAACALLHMESPSLGDYVHSVSSAHQQVKKEVQQLLSLNQEKLYDASHIIDAFPERSLRPGLIVMVAGVLFALMFIYLISAFYIRPVIRMRDATEGYLRHRDRAPVRFHASDELQELWLAIERLMERCDEMEGRHRGV